MRRISRTLFFGCCMGIGLVSAPAQAEEWEGRVSPYLWASGLDGDASVLPALPPVEVDDSFGDVFENLDIALMAVAEADNGNLYLRSDIFFASLTTGGETPSNLFSGAELNTETFNISTAVGLVAHKSDNGQVNVFAGGRLWNLNNELTFFPGVAQGTNFEADRTFVTPFIGANGRVRLSESVSATASTSVGGFGVSGADIELGGTATIEFDLGSSWGLAAGYRVLYLDYENDGFTYDLVQHGPVVGAFFKF